MFFITNFFSCDDILFEYANLGLGNGTAIAKFQISWFPILSNNQISYQLDNRNNLRVIIYKCAQLAPNCGTCLGLDTKRYACGWCDDELRCANADSCQGGWLLKGVGSPSCPHPRIDDFQPKKGPINGGTKVVIFKN